MSRSAAPRCSTTRTPAREPVISRFSAPPIRTPRPPPKSRWRRRSSSIFPTRSSRRASGRPTCCGASPGPAPARLSGVLWGFSRTGSAPAMRVTRITDDPADPGTQVAVRVINTCLPGVCGTSADGAVDARVFTAAQTINSPASTWAAVAPLTASAYANVATNSAYTFDFRPVGGATAGAALASGTGPAGTAQTIDQEAIPGTNIAGSAVTAILYSRNVVGSQATPATTPGVTFLWDRRPPRTCALCAPPQQ